MPATVIVITGTPGTGKTSVANKLHQENYFTINLFDFAKKYDCVEGFDETRDSFIVDMDKLYDTLEKYLSAGYGIVVFEGHYGDIVPDKFVSKIFVLSTPTAVLRARLQQRNYSREKINENIQAEIMQICWTDALEAYGPNKVTKIENLTIDESTELILSYLDAKEMSINT